MVFYDADLSLNDNLKKVCKHELFISVPAIVLSVVGGMIISLLPNPYFQLFAYVDWILVIGIFILIILWAALFIPYIKLRTKLFGILRFPSTKTKKNKSQYKLGMLNAEAVGMYLISPLLSWIIIFVSLFNY